MVHVAQVPARRSGRRTGAAQPPPTGLTVRGTVKTFTQVTDEMLKNPAPGDWLMLRRDSYASSYSPLTQITRDNASELQLAWVVADGRRRHESAGTARA